MRLSNVLLASSFISISLFRSASICIICFNILFNAVSADNFSSSNLIFVMFNDCKIAAFSASSFLKFGIFPKISNFDFVHLDTSV